MTRAANPFNSPLETGIRALTILVAVYPKLLDLQRLVDFDYLVVHSGDAGGPESLHVPLPLRPGELLVRRELIERGLRLMMRRGLIRRAVAADGIQYQASETASPFLKGLTSNYIEKLKERAAWLDHNFGNATDSEIRKTITQFFKEWTTQFQPREGKPGSR